MLLLRGRRRRMDNLGRRGDLDSLCRALLTRGLAALGRSLKHVLSAIFCKTSSPHARHVLGESQTRVSGPGRAGVRSVSASKSGYSRPPSPQGNSERRALSSLEAAPKVSNPVRARAGLRRRMAKEPETGQARSVGNVEEKSNKLLLALVMLFLFAMSVLQYVCPSKECQLLRLQAFSSPLPDPYRLEDESSARFVPRYTFSNGDLLRKVDFDIKGDDRIVFLHIQKTGGTTFGRHPVGNIQLEQPYECCVGQKTCTCHRPGKWETWLFSGFSTGWSCGLHADWTELTSCVPAVVDGKRDARQRPPR
ncbi:unnamed protein product [Rangifer tarandus platyrhynchus]|uniref:Heparan-sulfate 6-O-sulfotransferase n=1 Tax=Rangifer tarandus platyrhynchus TaxID=3082113 RepID=A0ABN8XNU0_RANTA|nr:unnamed protein product [Rangifer tarandus platyrhynchus]